MGTTPCPASGVWIRAASAQLPLRWGRFFATYGNERGRQTEAALLCRTRVALLRIGAKGLQFF